MKYFLGFLSVSVVCLLTGCASIDWSAIDWPSLPSAPATTNAVSDPPPVSVDPPSALSAAPWDRATRASCWDGANASKRMMNCLAPKFSEAKVGEYLEWQKARGCDTVDLILANQGDGEGAGYSIYGAAWDWTVDAAVVASMKARIERFRKAGFAVNLWLLTDDSASWNKLALADPARYCRDLAAAGLLRLASSVCVGLELTEYATRSGEPVAFVRGQVVSAVAALRTVYSGKVATHHNRGRLDFATLADLVWIQESPGVTEAQLGAAIDKALKLGKPVRAFELDRKPNRALCEFALRRGCYSVGNW